MNSKPSVETLTSLTFLMERGMHRNRALLDIAHRIERCQNCSRQMPGGCEPAHSALSEHGRGVGLKAHDCFFAALCDLCHRWLDNQGGSGRDPSDIYESTLADKREMFVRAMHKTWLEMWRKRLIMVTP